MNHLFLAPYELRCEGANWALLQEKTWTVSKSKSHPANARRCGPQVQLSYPFVAAFVDLRLSCEKLAASFQSADLETPSRTPTLSKFIIIATQE
jgi:hypothetical protein